jgi:pimeloyl-ACP methyl ester carboxylesterase
MKILWILCLWPLLLTTPESARAQDPEALRDSIEFHEFLRLQLPVSRQDNINLSMVHMIPNQEVSELPLARTLDEALNKIKSVKLADLIANNRVTPAAKIPVSKSQVLTLVILPGLFAEFLPMRPFEEILARPSKENADFLQRVKHEMKKGNRLAKDPVFDLKFLASRSRPLSDVIQVAALNDAKGKPRARLVMLSASAGSLESLGDISMAAAILNRRLGKYLGLTGAKNLVLIGYSRGTPVGLEMLAQAKEKKLPWVSEVRGMVAWAGHVSGSSLADETLNPSSKLFPVFEEIKKLRRDLDPQSAGKNFKTWADFSAIMEGLIAAAAQGKKYPDPAALVKNAEEMALDPLALWTTLKAWAQQAGLTSAASNDTANEVRRFRLLVDGTLLAIRQLSTVERTRWWSERILPLDFSYYALTAAMANPETGVLDREAFEGDWGYGRGSFDDFWMLQNRLDYEILTAVPLNDGQISLPQAVFLPELIAALNPANAGIKTSMLGTCGTHHWGMALQVVNPMKKKQINFLPREALLEALAEKISLDLEKKKY